MNNRILLLLIGIVILSVLDVFANVISLLPIVGDLAETVSEAIMETIQLALVGLLVLVLGVKR